MQKFKVIWLSLVVLILSGCLTTEPDEIYRSAVSITIENQCPSDISIIFKGLESDGTLQAFTGETDYIVKKRMVAHSKQSIKISVFYSQHKQYYNSPNDYTYNKYMTVEYNNKSKEYNFEPFIKSDAKLIVSSIDFDI